MSTAIETIEFAIVASRITFAEAATVMRVTRNTLYHWRNGRVPRVQVQADFALHQMKKVIRAIDARKLPLPVDTPPKERMQMLLEIVKIA
jgi:hypothetical protein